VLVCVVTRRLFVQVWNHLELLEDVSRQTHRHLSGWGFRNARICWTPAQVDQAVRCVPWGFWPCQQRAGLCGIATAQRASGVGGGPGRRAGGEPCGLSRFEQGLYRRKTKTLSASLLCRRSRGNFFYLSYMNYFIN